MVRPWHEHHHRSLSDRCNPNAVHRTAPKIVVESNGFEMWWHSPDFVHFVILIWLHPFYGKSFGRSSFCTKCSLNLWIQQKHAHTKNHWYNVSNFISCYRIYVVINNLQFLFGSPLACWSSSVSKTILSHTMKKFRRRINDRNICSDNMFNVYFIASRSPFTEWYAFSWLCIELDVIWWLKYRFDLIRWMHAFRQRYSLDM